MAVRYGSPLKRAFTFHIPLALMVGATLFPFYWMVVTSIRPDVELYNVKMNPFFTLLLMGYFKALPREIEECARIDGASRIQAMVRISFPLAVPGILSAGIFAFTLSWNEFLYALVFLSSPQQKTIPIGVFTELVRGDVFYWGPLMAGALLGSIPVALVYSFFVEHYVTALTGAVKG